MDLGPLGDDVDRVKKERDLYRKLLDLGEVSALDPFLSEALTLVVEAAGARRGYIELGRDREGEGQPRWWLAHGFSDQQVEEEVRESLSQGMIAAAVATGETITTASALNHPIFKKRGSVRRNKIEAVVCAPIDGGSDGPIGVVYLQDRIEPGPFTEEDRLRVEVFAKHLAPLADRLLAREEKKSAEDPTRAFRAALSVDQIIGRSAAIARVLDDIRLVARRGVTVLITGPNGSGKTDIARALHDNGPRKEGPFIALNAASFSEQLLENELFGHEKGAFTGADKRARGKVAEAEGGTLFLDEIGELPLGVQAKLLTLLSSKEYYPLGASKPERADVRFIAATNRDLKAAILERKFREDLYHRLNGFSIRVPSLAERREDIPLLMAHFSARWCEEEKVSVLGFSPGALRAAENAEWTGNVRELMNAVNTAALRAHGEGSPLLLIERRHLFPDEGGQGNKVTQNGKPKRDTLQEATRSFQAKYVQEVLDEVGWNVPKAAEVLDIARSHVYNLIKAYGLKRGKAE